MQQANTISYGAIGHVANNPFAASGGLTSLTSAAATIAEEDTQSATSFALPKAPSLDEGQPPSYQSQQ